MRSGLLSDLASIGYEIFLEGETIRLRYQKPDDPPDTAKQLIDELRKHKFEVLQIIKTGNTIIPPEKTQPRANTMVVWRNPYPLETPEARQESLQQVMMAIWESTFDRVVATWPNGFISTPEIHAAEIEIERVQSLVLSGKGKIADFRQAVEEWEENVKNGVMKFN